MENPKEKDIILEVIEEVMNDPKLPEKIEKYEKKYGRRSLTSEDLIRPFTIYQLMSYLNIYYMIPDTNNLFNYITINSHIFPTFLSRL